tara:strand:+ start:267 stop:497 length:231 start_codon:yes stop_codon:yes gene_type:complete
MADKYKKLTIYVSEEQEKVLKDFNVMAIRKEQFPLLHYTVGIISKRLAETNNRMITDVDPNTCDTSTLHLNSQTIE